jgi:hypothetical protein
MPKYKVTMTFTETFEFDTEEYAETFHPELAEGEEPEIDATDPGAIRDWINDNWADYDLCDFSSLDPDEVIVKPKT